VNADITACTTIIVFAVVSRHMGTEKPRSTITFEEDVYDELCSEHEKTGKDKSQIVNEELREGLLESNASWFLGSFAQSLFVIGFVLVAAGATSFAVGVAISMLGLGMMLWFQVEEHASGADMGYWEAFKRTLGVH
jgi:hypothetical protein